MLILIFMVYFQCSAILDILPSLICNDNGSVSITYIQQSFSIFVYVILEDGPCGPKHVVKIIRHVPK
jgi:hypothetical protein